MSVPSRSPFRFAVAMFAFVLGAQAIWILLPELIRASPTSQLKDQISAESDFHFGRVHWAAQVAFLRGDLWRDYVLALGRRSDGETGFLVFSPQASEDGRVPAEWAVKLAPHDAYSWLLLASLDLRLNLPTGRVAALLKMSYLTGATDVAVIPGRLIIVMRTPALADPELRNLLREEIAFILVRKPELKQAISTAYRYALAENKHVIDDILRELDPTFLQSIRSMGSR